MTLLTAKDPADQPIPLRCELLGGPLDGEIKWFPAPGPAQLTFQTSEETTLNGASSGRSPVTTITYIRVHVGYFLYGPLMDEAGQ